MKGAYGSSVLKGFFAVWIEAPCLMDTNDRREWFLDESLDDSEEWDYLYRDTRDDRGRFMRAA